MNKEQYNAETQGVETQEYFCLTKSVWYCMISFVAGVSCYITLVNTI